MQTIDQQESRQKAPQRKWQPLAAVAAFVLVIVVGVAAAMALRGGDEVTNVPAPPFDTPQEAVEAYYAVLNAGDAEAYFSLFADGASGELAKNRSGSTPSNAKINARVEGLQASGDTFVVSSCVEESELRVKCTIAADNPIRGLTAGAREWENSIVLTIDDAGLIQEIDERDFQPQSEIDDVKGDAWVAWMMENHSELWDETNDQLWGSSSDPLTRSGADIGRDKLAAAREFDAQYEG